MATSFDSIHHRTMAKVTDYDIFKHDIETRLYILDDYLLSAQVEFQRLCKVDLSDKDMDERQYNQDLSDEVIDILATGAAYYWLLPKVLNTENLYNVLNTKDFAMYSPANLLKELRALRDAFWSEFRRKMYLYTYRTANIADLRA